MKRIECIMGFKKLRGGCLSLDRLAVVCNDLLLACLLACLLRASRWENGKLMSINYSKTVRVLPCDRCAEKIYRFVRTYCVHVQYSQYIPVRVRSVQTWTTLRVLLDLESKVIDRGVVLRTVRTSPTYRHCLDHNSKSTFAVLLRLILI